MRILLLISIGFAILSMLSYFFYVFKGIYTNDKNKSDKWFNYAVISGFVFVFFAIIVLLMGDLL